MRHITPAHDFNRERLPDRRGSFIFCFEFEGHRYRATASTFQDGRLAEIFLDTSKGGSPLQTTAETAAVLTSLLLQHGVDAQTIRHSIGGPIGRALSLFAEQP